MTKTPDTTELICDCCLILLASSDESGCRGYYNHIDGSDDHPYAPMSLLPGDTSPGILHSEHEDGCDPTAADYEGCGCEETPFSTEPCAGCGTRLHGTRHAVTTWVQD